MPKVERKTKYISRKNSAHMLMWFCIAYVLLGSLFVGFEVLIAIGQGQSLLSMFTDALWLLAMGFIPFLIVGQITAVIAMKYDKQARQRHLRSFTTQPYDPAAAIVLAFCSSLYFIAGAKTSGYIAGGLIIVVGATIFFSLFLRGMWFFMGKEVRRRSTDLF